MSVRWSLPALLLMLGAADASAQSMRPFSTFRQWHGETRLAARLEYAAGTLRVGAGRTDELYRMDVSYDEDRFAPVSDFDASGGAVTLGVAAEGRGGVRVISQNQLRQSADVGFSPKTDLALDVQLGAVDGELDLGGLRISDLDLSAGASRATIRFSKPNGTRCRAAMLRAGAAQLSVFGLGNSRCDRIAFEGGVGKVTLDFGGTWTSNSKVDVSMALGELTLRLPRQVGVSVTLDKFLTSFEPEGLVRQGTSYLLTRVRASTAAPRHRHLHRRRRGQGGVERRRVKGWIGRHVAARDPGLRARHLFRFGAQSLRHGRDRRPVPALRTDPPSRPAPGPRQPVVWDSRSSLFVVEFVADKIPLVDSVWDTVHTFIRPPAAAFLSYSVVRWGSPGRVEASAQRSSRGPSPSHRTAPRPRRAPRPT